jgi:hypothetical protein
MVPSSPPRRPSLLTVHVVAVEPDLSKPAAGSVVMASDPAAAFQVLVRPTEQEN